jgi:hypothetical protein
LEGFLPYKSGPQAKKLSLTIQGRGQICYRPPVAFANRASDGLAKPTPSGALKATVFILLLLMKSVLAISMTDGKFLILLTDFLNQAATSNV